MSDKRSDIAEYLQRLFVRLRPLLPPHVRPEMFQRALELLPARHPGLAVADRVSLAIACAECARDGLLPDGQEAAIIARKNRVAYIPMLRGLIKLARQSGEVRSIVARAVYEHDHFEVRYGDDEAIVHVPATTDRGQVIGAYAIITLRDGEKLREVLTREDVRKIRTAAGNNSAWSDWEEEMVRKSAFRRASKWAPFSILARDADGISDELDRAIADDGTDIDHDYAPPPASGAEDGTEDDPLTAAFAATIGKETSNAQ